MPGWMQTCLGYGERWSIYYVIAGIEWTKAARAVEPAPIEWDIKVCLLSNDAGEYTLMDWCQYLPPIAWVHLKVSISLFRDSWKHRMCDLTPNVEANINAISLCLWPGVNIDTVYYSFVLSLTKSHWQGAHLHVFALVYIIWFFLHGSTFHIPKGRDLFVEEANVLLGNVGNH